MKHILHVAAENDALPGGKVGGIGDVVRDIAPALADIGCKVTVAVPSHGFLHRQPGARHDRKVGFFFRGAHHTADLYNFEVKNGHPRVQQVVVDHPFLDAFDPGAQRHRIYVNDAPDRPFQTDASRFACFGAAVAAAAAQGLWGDLDAIHLHDWHAAFVALLRRYDPNRVLQSIRTVFTIHNLALQGVRPLRGSDSSLEAWFPGLGYQWLDVADPRWESCCNMMACGMRLSDRVHVVSPAYAEEIRRPDNKPHAYGAEGLEAVTRFVGDNGLLSGILNGCAYPEDRRPPRLAFPDLMNALKEEVLSWCGPYDRLPASHFLAVERLAGLQRRADVSSMILTTVSRAVDQKLLILKAQTDPSGTALQRIMQMLGEQGCYVALATGDASYHRFLTQASAQHANMVFLNGYSARCAELLYANGDLFLMPSSFEPCGISQMLAMRDGQPCVAHAVGGLKDTIQNGRNGFLFDGGTLDEQANNFVETVGNALEIRRNQPETWEKLGQHAADARFAWEDTAQRYIKNLYRFSSSRKNRPVPEP